MVMVRLGLVRPDKGAERRGGSHLSSSSTRAVDIILVYYQHTPPPSRTLPKGLHLYNTIHIQIQYNTIQYDTML